nr:aldehyde dehydrogenase family protein [Bradyrhizobium ivorense]
MEPIGFAAAITPWNFSVAMIMRKAGREVCDYVCFDLAA